MRLIDADALDMYERLKSYYGMAWRDAQEEIDAQPTVDAVPVIRCRECKNYLTDDGIGIMCQMHYYRVKPTDFCSWAERRTE